MIPPQLVISRLSSDKNIGVPRHSVDERVFVKLLSQYFPPNHIQFPLGEILIFSSKSGRTFISLPDFTFLVDKFLTKYSLTEYLLEAVS